MEKIITMSNMLVSTDYIILNISSVYLANKAFTVIVKRYCTYLFVTKKVILWKSIHSLFSSFYIVTALKSYVKWETSSVNSKIESLFQNTQHWE